MNKILPTFTVTMKQVFGLSDQSPTKFMAELKALNDADKLWYHRELIKAGHECQPPSVAA